MVAGFLGSSSGIPASTFPTKSAPTSAAFVYIPPPTLANNAIEDAPKPKPAIIDGDSNRTHITVTPSNPTPTTVSPITLPVLNATLNALFKPSSAASAVLEFPLTAMFIPTIPAIDEPIAPTR